MTPQEIKANAPQGATHYVVDKLGNVFYLKKDKHINIFIGLQPINQLGSIKPL